MSIRNQEVVYRMNRYADFPQESRNFFLGSGIVPIIDWEKVRSYDSVHVLEDSSTITGVGIFQCFQVPVGKRYTIKKLTVSSGDAANTFDGALYLVVGGKSITMRYNEINGMAFVANQHLYLNFKTPLELRPRSTFSAAIGVKGGADSKIIVKMWGSITNDY